MYLIAKNVSEFCKEPEIFLICNFVNLKLWILVRRRRPSDGPG